MLHLRGCARAGAGAVLVPVVRERHEYAEAPKGRVVQVGQRPQDQVRPAVPGIGREQRVGHGDAAHARRLGRRDPVRGVLQRQAARRGDAQPARRGQVYIRRGLAAGLVHGRAAHLDAVQAEPVADRVDQPPRRGRRDREPQPAPPEQRDRRRDARHRLALGLDVRDDPVDDEARHLGVGQARHLGVGQARHLGVGQACHLGVGQPRGPAATRSTATRSAAIEGAAVR
jgi:hypothetical protein